LFNLINSQNINILGEKMKYSQAKQGRVFVIRLEDGDIIHKELEEFCKKKDIKAASVTIVGGADKKSEIIVGPEKGRSDTILPMTHILDNVYEVSGSGTIFPDEKGDPVLHMHIACGRETKTITGCVRNGVKVWHIMEVILFELVDCLSVRWFDPQTGFNLLKP
jgi:predicted DNA-binding protein with PD1-like motif